MGRSRGCIPYFAHLASRRLPAQPLLQSVRSLPWELPFLPGYRRHAPLRRYSSIPLIQVLKGIIAHSRNIAGNLWSQALVSRASASYSSICTEVWASSCTSLAYNRTASSPALYQSRKADRRVLSKTISPLEQRMVCVRPPTTSTRVLL